MRSSGMQWRPALPEPPVNTIRFPVDMMIVIRLGGNGRRGDVRSGTN